MFWTFFGLDSNPFEPACDLDLRHVPPTVQRLREELRQALRERSGLVLVLGRPGVGKTTLLRLLARDLEDEATEAWTVLASNARPQLAASDLVREVCTRIGAADRTGLATAESASASPGGGVALLIDDADRLGEAELKQFLDGIDPATLSALNLRVVLFGRPELGGFVARALRRELRQPMMQLRRLEPLSEDELRQLIAGQVERSGGEIDRLFTPDAVRRIFERAQGVPHAASAMGSFALYAAFLKSEQVVSAERVEQAAALLAGADERDLRSRPVRGESSFRSDAGAAAVPALAAAGRPASAPAHAGSDVEAVRATADFAAEHGGDASSPRRSRRHWSVAGFAAAAVAGLAIVLGANRGAREPLEDGGPSLARAFGQLEPGASGRAARFDAATALIPELIEPSAGTPAEASEPDSNDPAAGIADADPAVDRDLRAAPPEGPVASTPMAVPPRKPGRSS